MGIGPVEYMIVAFPGNEFKGAQTVPALKELVDAGTIRTHRSRVRHQGRGRHGGGRPSSCDLDSDVYKAFDALSPETMGLLNEEDLGGRRGRSSTRTHPPHLLAWEDVWATKLRDAIVCGQGASSSISSGSPTRSSRQLVDFAEANK